MPKKSSKKPPISLDPPTPEVALLQLQTSLLMLLLLTRHALRLMFHPTTRTISDGLLMEAILKDSHDRSDSSVQLLDMVMSYNKVLDNCRPQKIVTAMKLGSHLGKAARPKARRKRKT